MGRTKAGRDGRGGTGAQKVGGKSGLVSAGRDQGEASEHDEAKESLWVGPKDARAR